MKRLILILLLIMASTSVFAQNENYKMVMNKLISNFNADQYEKIFNDFSAEMQQALPLEKTKQFFSGLKTRQEKLKVQCFSMSSKVTMHFIKPSLKKWSLL